MEVFLPPFPAVWLISGVFGLSFFFRGALVSPVMPNVQVCPGGWSSRPGAGVAGSSLGVDALSPVILVCSLSLAVIVF